MKNLLRQVPIILILIFLFACTKAPESWKVFSPGKHIKIVVERQSPLSDQLEYSVFFDSAGNEKTVVEPSPLGIKRDDSQFVTHLNFSGRSDRVIDESYTLVTGSRLKNRNLANEMTLVFRNPEGDTIEMIFRAYDEGFALCYHFPEKSPELYTIEQELTAFHLPVDGKAWMQPYDSVSWWAPGYEQYYGNGIPIGTASPANRNGWAFPALFNTNGLWILISEAGLDSSYCAMHLCDHPEDGLYSLRFPEINEAFDSTGQKPVSTLPWTTPWRYGIVADHPGTIVMSNMVYDLNRPSVISDVSWIKPGRSSWSWWSAGSSPRDFNRLKEYVDLSAKFGWEYSLVDAGWGRMKNGDLTELVNYANSRNVGILVWYDSGSRVKIGRSDPLKSMIDPVIRRKEFEWLKETGVKGIKVDFFLSDKQETIKLYQGILEDAAHYGLLVNFHGCTMPTGWSRTYPNLLTMEAVRGAESYRFDKTFPEQAAQLNTILPFTRNVVGPMDYTPVTFSSVNYPHLTTNAHELALSVIFQSGLLHFADNDKIYLGEPEEVQDFLKSVPVSWDETRFIEGYPGEMIVLARRKGYKWFIAGINGQDKSINISPDLSFLGNAATINIISDGPDGKTFLFNRFKLSDGNPEIGLLPRGGFAAFTE